MSSSRFMKPIAALALPALVVALLSCSTDSPTAPTQQPSGGPAPPSANWVLTISVLPDLLRVNDQTPATVSVDVRRADNNQAPPAGSTIVISTTLGEFNSPGSGLSSAAVGTLNGRAQVQLFAGTVTGVAVVTAQLEGSAAQTTIEVLEELPPLVANFTFQNTTDNLSIQFLNTSTGGPDSFLWDFGDGSTSEREHPDHTYDAPGDYAVELQIFRGQDSAEQAQLVRAVRDAFITGVRPRTVRPGDNLNILGQGFDNAIRVFFNGVLAELLTKSSDRLLIRVPSGLDFPSEPCDATPFDGFNELNGTRPLPIVSVTLQIEVSGNVGSDSVSVELTVEPLDDACVVNPDENDDLFITEVRPNTGSASGGQTVTIEGAGFVSPLRVFFGSGLATTVSSTLNQIVVRTPPGVLQTAACDIDGDGTQGEVVVDTLVDVTVELGAGLSHTAPGAFTYLAPIGAPCNGD